jgi:hypothetical protein
MKLLCICDDAASYFSKFSLIIGEKYDVGYISSTLVSEHIKDNFFYIICSDGEMGHIKKSRFLKIEDYREQKLNEILK